MSGTNQRPPVFPQQRNELYKRGICEGCWTVENPHSFSVTISSPTGKYAHYTSYRFIRRRVRSERGRLTSIQTPLEKLPLQQLRCGKQRNHTPPFRSAGSTALSRCHPRATQSGTSISYTPPPQQRSSRQESPVWYMRPQHVVMECRGVCYSPRVVGVPGRVQEGHVEREGAVLSMCNGAGPVEFG